MDETSFVWLPSQPANEQVLFAHFYSFWSKATSFLNAHKNYRCEVSTLKLSEKIALFHAQFAKLIFIEVGESSCLGGQVEK